MLTKNSVRLLLGALCLTLPSLSMAEAPIYLWDNEEGFINGLNCEIEASDQNPFMASQFYSSKGEKKDTENLRNSKGVMQSHLVNHSLVKVIDENRGRNTKPVEVIGVNKRTEAKKNRWFSERGDKGYLHSNSLRPIEDFVFSVTTNEKEVEKVASENEAFRSGEEMFLRAASGASYFRATCDNTKEREYILFRAYQKGHGDSAIFYAGVSAEETSLFSNLNTYGKVESMSFLSEVGQEAPLAVIEPNSLVVTAPPSLEEELEASNDALEAIASEIVAEKEESGLSSSLKPKSRPKNLPIPTPRPKVSLQHIVCTSGSTLNVRDENLDDVLFKAKIGERIALFQSFGEETDLEEVINGKKYVFKKVEFKERESSDERVGYIAESFIKTEGDCPALKDIPSLRLNPPTTISGLKDEKCCDFPTAAKPTHSYTSGMRRFRAGRSGGRLHAACDLYRYKNEPARSVAPGKVIRDMYKFYQGTYAVEVRHAGGFVVRYGELTGKRFVRGGQSVKMGQRLGNIGVVNSGCCRPMLHFELYSGSKRGSLSTGSGRYRRRSDLMDPTPYLLKWQDKVF